MRSETALPASSTTATAAGRRGEELGTLVKRRAPGLGRGAAGYTGRIREGESAGGAKASSPRRAAAAVTGAEGEESTEELK